MKNQLAYAYTESLVFEVRSFLSAAYWSKGILTVVLKNGRKYEYKTPRRVIRAWRVSDSAGSYFNSTVKKYPVKK